MKSDLVHSLTDIKKVERRLISDEKKTHKKPDSLGDRNLK